MFGPMGTACDRTKGLSNDSRLFSLMQWTVYAGGPSAPPPLPLHSTHPCIVSGGAEGTITFRFANLLRRSDIELLLCGCWLDKVVLALRLCGQRVRVVYGDWQMFLPTESCTSHVIFPRQTACHRGWSPLSSPLPSLLPKLLNLVPIPQPRVQPNLLPRWQPSLQPSLQLESPFLWPLWSMCSSSGSNTPARKSGTQSLFLSRAEHASQQAVPGSFVVHSVLCLHVLPRVPRPLHSNRGCEGTVTWGILVYVPGGCEGTVVRNRLLCRGGGGQGLDCP